MQNSSTRDQDDFLAIKTEEDFAVIMHGMKAGDANEALILHQAVTRRFTKALSSLLKRGHLDVNIMDRQGITALHVAVSAADSLSVDLLIEAGADVNSVDDTGQSPLHIMCSHSSLRNIAVTWFRDAKFLHMYEPVWKVRLDKIRIIQSLILKGSDVFLGDRDGWSPFDMSKSMRDSNMRKLVAAKAKDVQTSRKIAIAMALHERLGSTSLVGYLGNDLLRMVCDIF